MRRLFLVIILFMPVWVVAGSSIAVQDELLRLDNDDWQIRMSAAQALANLRPDDKSSIAAISLALKDDDSRVRRAAADALGEIGSSASRSLPQIVSLFSDGDANVIAAAARAVGKIGSRSSRYSEDLIKLMAHRDERVREAATEALGASGRSRKRVDDLQKQLSDPAPSVRVAAAIVLGDIGPRAAPASQKIVRLLADDDASVREAAQQALAGIGKPAVRALMAAIGSGDPVFSLDIVATLVRIGSDSISALTETFGDSDGPLLARRYSAMALAELYDTDARVIVVLTKGLVDENAEIRAAAAEGLGDVGMPAESALPQLLLMSRDQREPSLVRERVISALADIAPADRDVNAALVAGVSDSNPRIYEAAIAALVEISSSPDSPASKELAQLVRDLHSGDDQSKSAAADRLGALGPYAATAVPDLIAVLAGQENSADLQVAAATALGLIGSNAEAAVPELIRMLEVHDPALRDAVLIALERIGPQQKAVPALMRSMRAGDLATRASAAEAVRQFVNARLDTWRPLLHQSDAPVLRNWLSRHDELYGVGVGDLLVRAEPETDTPNYFDVLGGREDA